MARRGKGTGPRSHARAIRSKATPVRIATGLLIALVLIVLAAGAILVKYQADQVAANTRTTADASTPLPSASIAASDGAEATQTQAAAGTATAAASPTESVGFEVEVPDVIGKPLKDAEILLDAAGFKTLTRVQDPANPSAPADVITAMSPAPGTRIKAGDSVTVTYNPRQAASAAAPQPTVVIDPGHQAKADLTLEPIGPGATEMKEKVRGGCTGVSTRVPEYKRALDLSLKLRDKLQAAGVKVVMVRTTNDVNVANSERAKIGNRAGAALTIRIHFDANANSSVHGISTLYPTGTKWSPPIEGPSKRAAGLVQASVVGATGASSRGIVGRSDMTGFNWSTVPTIIVENGFLSNAAEDKLIATSAYQEKLASGLAKGVLDYLGM